MSNDDLESGEGEGVRRGDRDREGETVAQQIENGELSESGQERTKGARGL